MDPTLIPFIAFPVFFPLMWVFVCFVLSRIGGWSELAENYRTTEKPTGKRFSMANGRIGGVNYNKVLTLYGTKDGFYLTVFFLFKVGHPDLFIPWSTITDVQFSRLLWFEYSTFYIGTTKIQLSKKAFEEMLLEKTE